MIGNTLKKYICVFMAVVSLTACIFMPVAFADSATEDIAYLNKVLFLEKLGIITQDDAMQYSNETITRENFAAMLGVFYDIPRLQTTFSDGKGMFLDVEIKNPSCALIETVVDAGAMEGYQDRKFRPSSELTVIQAVKSMLALLGYDALVSAKGNNNNAYTRQAHELDLLAGVKTPYSGAIKKGELVNMLCTALDTEILQVSDLGSKKSYKTVPNETLLSEYLGIYKEEGILQATDITGVGRNDSVRKGYISVNGKAIKTEEDMNSYLGMNLNVYYIKDSADELNMIHFYPDSYKNREITVDAEDADGLSGNTFSYKSDGKKKQIRLSNNFSVIYNGKNNPLYTSDMFEINDGSIRFLDANSDGRYETVFIKNYVAVWVGQVYNDNGNISLIDNIDPTKKYTFDTTDVNKTIRFIKNNNLVTLNDIKADDVVLIAANKSDFTSASYFEILISDAKAEGYIDEIVSGVDEKLTVDGKDYEMIKAFSLNSYNLSVGNTAKFYLDAFGRVAYAKKVEANVMYGILNGVATENFPVLVKSMRVYATDGSFKVFDCARKITIDGKRYSAENDIEAIKTALKTGKIAFFNTTNLSTENADEYFQLIKYSLNSDGQINMIDTLNSPSYETTEDNLYYSNKFENDGINKVNYFGKANATTIEGGYVYDGSLKIFALPSDKGNLDAYSIKTSMLSLGYEVLPDGDIVYAFDVDEFKYVPVMIVEKEIGESVANEESNNMMIFESLTQELSPSEEACYVLNGTSVKSAAKMKLFLTDDAYTQYKTSGVKSGDIIRWIYDDLNYVTTLEILLDNEGNTSKMNYSGSLINDSSFYSTFRITCGTVEKYNDKFILFNLGAKKDTSFKNPSAKVLVYDSLTGTVASGDYSMIKTNEAFPGEASLVFTLQTSSAINSLVIFN